MGGEIYVLHAEWTPPPRVKSTINFQWISIKRLGFMTILPNVRDLSVRCFWNDPGLFFMKIQRNTLKNCTISLNWPGFEENIKTHPNNHMAYHTIHAQNKVVPP